MAREGWRDIRRKTMKEKAMHSWRNAGLTVVLTVMLGSAGFAQEQAAPLEKYAPAGAMMEMYYQGLAGAEAGFKGTALMDIVNEPEVQDWGKEIARFTDLMLGQNLPDPTLLQWKDIRMLLDCEALAVVVDTGKPEPKAAVVIRSHGKREDMKKLFDRIIMLALGPDGQPETVKGEGVDFLKFGDACVGWLGEDLLICEDMEIANLMLSTRNGKTPGLAEDAGYQKLAKKAAGGPEFVRFYVDVEAVVKSMGREPAAEEVASVMKKLGIDSCSKVYANVTPDSPGTKLRAYLYMPKGVNGLWKVLPRERLDEKKLLAGMPGEATSVGFSRTSLGDLVDAINLVMSIEEETTLNDILKEKAGFDVLGELSKSLGNEMTYDVVGPGFFMVPEFYVSVPVKDRAACRKTLDKLVAALPKGTEPAAEAEAEDAPDFPSASVAVDVMQYKGQTIEAVKLTGIPLMFAPSFMLTEDKLIIAAIPQTLKKYVDRQKTQGKSLAENPYFTASRSHVSANASCLMYTDPRRGFASLYGGLVTYLVQMTNGIPGAPLHNLATRLPSTAAIVPHLVGSVSAISYDGEGFLLESYDTMGGMFSGCSEAQVGSVAQLGMMAGFMLPALSHAQRSARAASSLNNERQIMLSMIQYAGDHDDKFPESMGVLLKENYLNSPKVFFHPGRGNVTKRLAGFPTDLTDAPLEELNKIEELSDYAIVKGVQHTDDADMIVVYEKDGVNRQNRRICAFNDGHVQELPEPVFQQMLKDQQEKLKKAGDAM